MKLFFFQEQQSQRLGLSLSSSVFVNFSKTNWTTSNTPTLPFLSFSLLLLMQKRRNGIVKSFFGVISAPKNTQKNVHQTKPCSLQMLLLSQRLKQSFFFSSKIVNFSGWDQTFSINNACALSETGFNAPSLSWPKKVWTSADSRVWTLCSVPAGQQQAEHKRGGGGGRALFLLKELFRSRAETKEGNFLSKGWVFLKLFKFFKATQTAWRTDFAYYNV